ncbi:hypothetical protein [uncultured Amaricoccus sp.]|uniref:hypothetical protein n=1 Tax=uncultured Amaricoccus sp. TaxID=339341 RepID=UPI00261BF96E|nr:hypothetical protein [uncultured Amaricoccus sp.]
MTCLSSAAGMVLGLALLGCTNARYNVPYAGDRDNAAPSAQDITIQIQCELMDLVRRDSPYHHSMFLDKADLTVAANLELTVNSSGNIIPTAVAFDGDPFGLALGAKLGREVERTFSRTVSYDTSDYGSLTVKSPEYGDCIRNRSRFSGTFGIGDLVDLAISTGKISPTDKFGGSFSLKVTRNLGSIGPAWHYASGSTIGALGNLDDVTTNKITFGFSSTPPNPSTSQIAQASVRAQEYLNTLLLQPRQ